jgi:general secretion pathway protein E
MLCQQCKEPYEPTAYELKQLALDPARLEQKARRKLQGRYDVHGVEYRFIGQEIASPAIGGDGKPAVFFRAKGCDACGGKGFIGRRGIYELMAIDDIVGPLILKHADAVTVKRAAMAAGMDTLRDDGARKVLRGMTTVEEVLAATQEDVVVDE